MLTVLAALGVLVVLFVAGAVATREDQALQPVPEERADVALPARPLRAADLDAVRFGVTVRGYRMSEVDDVLARLAAELADRDARLEALGAGLMASADSSPSERDAPELAWSASSAPGPVDFPDVLPAEPDADPVHESAGGAEGDDTD